MHGYTWGCREAEADLVAVYGEHSDGDFVTNLHGLSHASGQNEHGASTFAFGRAFDAQRIEATSLQGANASTGRR